MSVEKATVAAKRKSSGWGGQIVQLAGIVVAVFIAKGALAEPFYVPSGSMEPTLLIGDALLASKFPYGYGTSSLPIQISLPETGRVFAETPKQGDVVVFRWPGDPSQIWVKRVVGLPGDRIAMRGGRLWINGKPVDFIGYRDNVFIPALGSITLRIPFTDPVILGKFVYHCHIMEHEDGGMMQVIQVVRPADYDQAVKLEPLGGIYGDNQTCAYLRNTGQNALEKTAPASARPLGGAP